MPSLRLNFPLSFLFYLLKQRAKFQWWRTLRYPWKASGEHRVLFISLGEWIFLLERFLFEKLHRSTIIFFCLLKRVLKCYWLLAKMLPLGLLIHGALGPPGWPEMNYTWVICRNVPEYWFRSALLRQCFAKAQARVMNSLEIQRLSPSSMLDAKLLSETLLGMKLLELKRAASE